MKYDEDDKWSIDNLYNKGWSGRKIAKVLNLSKSGVNEYINKNLKKQESKPSQTNSGPRILVLDVETAAASALSFGRFKVNLSQDNILKEGGWILCASWHWLGSTEIQAIWLTPEEVLDMDDSRIVDQLFQLYSKADAIVAHNGCSFDQKVIQTRTIANGLPPLPAVKVLDTLLLARRYLRLPSNKLDSIGEYFNLGRKINHSGISMWKDVQSGNVEAMKDMVEYCVQDVDLLLNVYLKLRPLGIAGNGINAALYYEDDHIRCSICGSNNLTGTSREVYTTVNKFNEYRCNECGAIHKDKYGKVDKEKRKSLLALTS